VSANCRDKRLSIRILCFAEPNSHFIVLLYEQPNESFQSGRSGFVAPPIKMQVARLQYVALQLSAIWLLAISTFPLQAAEVIVQASADTSFHQNVPDFNMGGNEFVAAGANGSLSPARALFKFSLDEVIPSGSMITSVSLQLSVIGVPNLLAADSTFELRRLNQNWNEGFGLGPLGSPAGAGETTWNARFYPDVLWSVPGGASPHDFAGAVSSTSPVSGISNYIFSSTPTMVADVQGWVDSPESNYGWILISQSEDVSRTARRFGSRTSASPPQLTIEFQARPAFDSVVLSDQSIQLEFTAEASHAYSVEFKDSLETLNWSTLINYPVQSVDGTLIATDSITSSPQRFYRLARTQ